MELLYKKLFKNILVIVSFSSSALKSSKLLDRGFVPYCAQPEQREEAPF